MGGKKVLSIGQCFADHTAIVNTIGRHFQAEVIATDSGDEATKLLLAQAFDLVLVNRILDANGHSGLEVIRQLKADDGFRDVPVMLVSNYEDAQRQAAELGAEPGFGKAALGHPATLSRLQRWLGESG
jgi:CheY-like chemotaxis protein